MTTATPITIPDDLKPSDSRFGCGPSKVRQEAVDSLAATASTFLGTSHRQATVQFTVAALRNGIAEMLVLPDGYEVLLGNGGTTAFWDAATFHLVDDKAQMAVMGEFSSKFAKAIDAAPHLGRPEVIEAEPGNAAHLQANAEIDTYCMVHNETSTGVATNPVRPDGDGLVLVDATSAAAGLRFDASATDCYYFAPQKCLASDGGLWIAACSPAAIERIERLAASDRWCPAFFDLGIALTNSRKDQTYNTPALATIYLALEQVSWINNNGGINWSAGRCDANAEAIYGWAEAHELASPFITDTDIRSHVVATIDFDDKVDANVIAATLRANDILDTESYRKLGRNQLRISLFPAIETEDLVALTRCIDHIIEGLTA